MLTKLLSPNRNSPGHYLRAIRPVPHRWHYFAQWGHSIGKIGSRSAVGAGGVFPLGPDFGDGNAAFAGHRIEQVNLPVFREDRRIAKLVDVAVGGASDRGDERRVGAFP